jgi:hypothetical protein
MAEAEAQGSPPDAGASGRVFGGTSFVVCVVFGAFFGACISLVVATARWTVVRRRLGRQDRELG